MIEPKTIKVVNLRTGELREYYGQTPKTALRIAYLQGTKGDYNTADYFTPKVRTTLPKLEVGKYTYLAGDWSVFKDSEMFQIRTSKWEPKLVIYLPSKSFRKSVGCLDDDRLKQQMHNALIILDQLSKPEPVEGEEPAIAMWRGYSGALKKLATMCIQEMWKRDITVRQEDEVVETENALKPWWVGEERLHKNHQGNLKRLDEDYYEFTEEVDKYDRYVWPSGCPIGVNVSLFTKATILQSKGKMDQVILHSDMPAPFPPAYSKDPLTFSFQTERGTGHLYMRKNFPAVPYFLQEI